jgi:hypothetical protein
LLAHGGILALPLSLAIGALCALLDRRLHEIERIVAAIGPARQRRPRPQPVAGRATAAHPRVLPPLAFGLARRPPPLAAG